MAIATHLGIARQTVYQTSNRSITSGQQVFPAITKALQQAKAVVVLLTPNSLWSPWVHFEAGGGHFLRANNLFVVAARGIGATAAPSNLLPYTIKELGSRRSVNLFLQDLSSHLGRPRTKSKRAALRIRVMNRVVQLATQGSQGWDMVEPAMVARKVSGSPFQFRKLLHQASKSVFLVGQNLWFLTRGPDASDVRRELLAFLRRPGTSARILVQEADTEGAGAWNSLQSDFSDDLDKSLDQLRVWLDRAKRLGINRRIKIKTAKLVPLSFDIFDADLQSGCMVVRPVLQRAPQPEDRPAFALYGGPSNPAFKYYCDRLNTVFTLSDPFK